MKCRDLVSVAEFTTSERSAFTNALLALKTAPSRVSSAAAAVTAGGGTPNRYDDYVWMHNTVGARAHFGSAFGPWHREFLRQFEFDLRQVSSNPDIVIPYWDWTTGRTSADANWPFTDDLLGPLGDATGIVQTGPFSNSATWRMNIRRSIAAGDPIDDNSLRLRRRPAAVSAGFNLPTAASARTGMAQATPYDAIPYNEASLLNTATNAQIQGWINASFRKYLEWVLHNGVHTWTGGADNLTPNFIGGPMAFPPVAVNDPTFWLHHCNIDRLWSTWQQRHTPGTYVPTSGANLGHNLNDEMLHFEAANAANFNEPLRGRPAEVVDSRGQLDIWYHGDLPVITLVTASLDFGDVPANLTTDWPVKFDVRTCRDGLGVVKFRITGTSGTNFRPPLGQGDVPAPHGDTADPVRANVFVEFQALGTVNVAQAGSVTIGAFIDDTEGYFTGTPGTEFQVGTWSNIGLTARPVPAPQAAVTLVLDRSGSMGDSAGPAGTKYDLLQSSLRVVASAMRDNDAIGLVSFDDVVANLTTGEVPMGAVSPPGLGRQAVEAAITSGGLVPRNTTAIGDGMIAGANMLQTVQNNTTYPIKAMVVMTDGINTAGTPPTAQSVHNAVSWFSNNVYAIGLGNETNVDTGSLNAISRYLLITGNISNNEQRFLLTKYFLQVLAQIANNAVIVDPAGELRPGQEHRITFAVADSDVSIDVIALCPLAPLLEVTLLATDGTVITPGISPNVKFHVDAEDSVYRVLLPAIPGNPAGTHGGQWTAVLRVRDIKEELAKDSTREEAASFRQALTALDRQSFQSVARLGALPYQLMVQSYSNLKLEVEVQQDSFDPGVTLTLLASLNEYLVPMDHRARVIVEITDPTGGETPILLDEFAPGRFRGTYATSFQGTYLCRFRADGVTRGGKQFQREETRTAPVNAKIQPPSPTSQPGRGPGDQRWCSLVKCLLGERSIQAFLKRHEIDPHEVAACVTHECAEKPAPHAPPLTPREERMRQEIETLRHTFATRVPIAAAELEHVLVAAPPSRPVVPAKPTAMELMRDAKEEHHRHSLPFLIVDDEGNPVRLVRPSHDAPGHDQPDKPHRHK